MLRLKYCLSALLVGSQQSAFCSYHTLDQREEEEVELQDYVPVKIIKVEKETPLHPNVLLAPIVELDEDCTKIITKFGYITTNRLSKI